MVISCDLSEAALLILACGLTVNIAALCGALYTVFSNNYNPNN